MEHVSSVGDYNPLVGLSIALEALYGDDDRLDFTYRLSLRIALLLETKLERRRAIRTTVKKFYAIRGKAAHGIPVDPQGATELIKEADDICARTLRKIAALGSTPKWSDVEFAGGL